ncbi:hypothetical protein ACTFIY_007289 [Dictyostelium cf. discoideum]
MINNCPSDVSEKKSSNDENFETIVRVCLPSETFSRNDGVVNNNNNNNNNEETTSIVVNPKEFTPVPSPLDLVEMGIPVTNGEGNLMQWSIKIDEFANAYSSYIKKNLLVAGFSNQQLEESSRSFFGHGQVFGSTGELTIYDSRWNPIKSQLTDTSTLTFFVSTNLDTIEHISAKIINEDLSFEDGEISIKPNKHYFVQKLHYYCFETTVKGYKNSYDKGVTIECSITGYKQADGDGSGRKNKKPRPQSKIYSLTLPEIKFVGKPKRVEPPKKGEVIAVAKKIDGVECKIAGHHYYKLFLLSNYFKAGKSHDPAKPCKYNKSGGFQVVLTIKETNHPSSCFLVKQFRNSRLHDDRFLDITQSYDNNDLFPHFGNHFTIDGEPYRKYQNKILRFTDQKIAEVILALKENNSYDLNVSYDNQNLIQSNVPQCTFNTNSDLSQLSVS